MTTCVSSVSSSVLRQRGRVVKMYVGGCDVNRSSDPYVWPGVLASPFVVRLDPVVGLGLIRFWFLVDR